MSMQIKNKTGIIKRLWDLIDNQNDLSKTLFLLV